MNDLGIHCTLVYFTKIAVHSVDIEEIFFHCMVFIIQFVLLKVGLIFFRSVLHMAQDLTKQSLSNRRSSAYKTDSTKTNILY